MKRFITIVTIVSVLFLTACSKSPAPQSSTEPDITSTPASSSIPEATDNSSAEAKHEPEPSLTAPPESQGSGSPDIDIRQEPEQPKEMTVSSVGIVGGAIADKYGKRGSQQSGGTPTLSIPISISGAPEGTVCYAIRMLDPDSKPLCGYEWAHWLAVNIEASELPENASIDLAADMVQGKNDFGSIGYGGPTPPDKPHTYVITVYAMDAKVDLQNGFSKDEFDAAISGYVLAEAEIKGSYSN